MKRFDVEKYTQFVNSNPSLNRINNAFKILTYILYKKGDSIQIKKIYVNERGIDFSMCITVYRKDKKIEVAYCYDKDGTKYVFIYYNNIGIEIEPLPWSFKNNKKIYNAWYVCISKAIYDALKNNSEKSDIKKHFLEVR